MQKSDYEVMEEGTDTIISPQHTLCGWNFSTRLHGSTFYSSCTFNIRGSIGIMQICNGKGRKPCINRGYSIGIVK